MRIRKGNPCLRTRECAHIDTDISNPHPASNYSLVSPLPCRFTRKSKNEGICSCVRKQSQTRGVDYALFLPLPLSFSRLCSGGGGGGGLLSFYLTIDPFETEFLSFTKPFFFANSAIKIHSRRPLSYPL